MIEFRDRMARELGFDLLVHVNQDGIERHRPIHRRLQRAHPCHEDDGAPARRSRNTAFDAALAGARATREVARQGSIFSIRSAQHGWIRSASGPEIVKTYNTRVGKARRCGSSLSNWTEFDIWQYIPARGNSDRAALFRGQAPVVKRDGMLIYGRRRPHAPSTRRGGYPNSSCVSHAWLLSADAGGRVRRCHRSRDLREMLTVRTPNGRAG
ncbi:phosphoadenosine phosphosulfate reductase family protein (plasmid) [Sinorhizobium meliloti]|nr:phosphoadenosine phosphosulfate reductase family protein [Sinorhizobium meliloti]